MIKIRNKTRRRGKRYEDEKKYAGYEQLFPICQQFSRRFLGIPSFVRQSSFWTDFCTYTTPPSQSRKTDQP